MVLNKRGSIQCRLDPTLVSAKGFLAVFFPWILVESKWRQSTPCTQWQSPSGCYNVDKSVKDATGRCWRDGSQQLEKGSSERRSSQHPFPVYWIPSCISDTITTERRRLVSVTLSFSFSLLSQLPGHWLTRYRLKPTGGEIWKFEGKKIITVVLCVYVLSCLVTRVPKLYIPTPWECIQVNHHFLTHTEL